MDTRDGKSKTHDDLGRHQRVLDAYLAHAGSDALPPPGLDAKLIALAKSAVEAANNAPHRANTNFARTDSGEIAASPSKTGARARRRQWPFALAASVATIGFAAILARTAFHDAPDYGVPSYEAGSFDAKNVVQDQAPLAAAPGVDDLPATVHEERVEAGRDQAAPVAATLPAEDKAKLTRAAEAELERSEAQAFASVPAPESTAPMPVEASRPLAAARPAAEIALAKRAAERAEPAFAPPPEPVSTAAAAAAPAPAPPLAAEAAVDAVSPPAELAPSVLAPSVLAPSADAAELDVQAADARSRRSDVGATSTAAISTETGVAEPAAAPMAPANADATGGAALAEAKPAPQRSSQTPPGQAQPAPSTRGELATSEASTPLDAATNSKKDEVAADAQAGPTNSHAKAFLAIRALRDSGELLKAKAMLARFRKAYPRAILPDDLKMLEKTR